MKSILISVTVLLMLSCASKKNVSANSTSQSQTSKIMNDTTPIIRTDTLPLIVEFYSIGEGVKAEPKMRLDNFIKIYEKNLNKSISYQLMHWGREGEYDACFRLGNLNEEQRDAFITELKKLFDETSFVHILENQTCSHIR